MFKGLGNIASMLKQAQQFQGRMSELQQTLERLRVEGNAGAGMVTVEATGHMKIVSVRIDESLVASNDKEMLEELLVAATNAALDKAREAAAAEMEKLTGGLQQIPGMGDMLSKLGMGDSDLSK
jgi:DNA-binding YbaB/EbfC family protein